MDEVREELEQAALRSICACYYYQLADTIDEMSDQDLRDIINDPQWVHHEQQRQQPVAYDEYLEGLASCPQNR